MEYDFGPGEYAGNWVWKGPFTLSIANCAVSTGTYQLRMFTGTEGTVELRDFNGLAHAVANVDLGNRLMNFKSVIFRPDNYAPPEAPAPGVPRRPGGPPPP
jgi:hypothetical protein